jgi:ornithine decarboxylase
MTNIQENRLNIYDENEFDLEKAISDRIQCERDGFYVCCLSDVIKKYDQWIEKMPRIKPFYAVKCNDDMVVLKVLATLGTGFDCATKQEIDKVKTV